MKHHYFLLMLPALLTDSLVPAERAQVSLTDTATLYVGPGGTTATPCYLSVGTGTTLTNEGQLA